MLEELKTFNRTSSLEKLKTHCLNNNINLKEVDDTFAPEAKQWKSAILWGNDDIHGVIIVKFTTLGILSLASNVFHGTNDANLFDHARDFMKEYCNFYAGFIKGTFNNENQDIKISLPIMSESFSIESCFGGNSDNIICDRWLLGEGIHYLEVEGLIKLSNDFDHGKFSFLRSIIQKEKKVDSKEGNIEFF